MMFRVFTGIGILVSALAYGVFKMVEVAGWDSVFFSFGLAFSVVGIVVFCAYLIGSGLDKMDKRGRDEDSKRNT